MINLIKITPDNHDIRFWWDSVNNKLQSSYTGFGAEDYPEYINSAQAAYEYLCYLYNDKDNSWNFEDLYA